MHVVRIPQIRFRMSASWMGPSHFVLSVHTAVHGEDLLLLWLCGLYLYGISA